MVAHRFRLGEDRHGLAGGTLVPARDPTLRSGAQPSSLFCVMQERYSPPGIVITENGCACEPSTSVELDQRRGLEVSHDGLQA